MPDKEPGRLDYRGSATCRPKKREQYGVTEPGQRPSKPILPVLARHKHAPAVGSQHEHEQAHRSNRLTASVTRAATQSQEIPIEGSRHLGGREQSLGDGGLLGALRLRYQRRLNNWRTVVIRRREPSSSRRQQNEIMMTRVCKFY